MVKAAVKYCKALLLVAIIFDNHQIDAFTTQHHKNSRVEITENLGIGFLCNMMITSSSGSNVCCQSTFRMYFMYLYHN